MEKIGRLAKAIVFLKFKHMLNRAFFRAMAETAF